MRLSTSMIYQNSLNGILNSQSTLLGLQQQISSGRRIVTPSDDPLGAGEAVNDSQNLSMTGNYAANRQTANRSLGLEDNTLSGVVSNLQSVLSRIVQAGNGTLSDADRQTLSTVLTNSRDALMSLANSNDGNGQYLFSGYQGGTPAYTQDAVTGAISYAGDQGQRMIQVEQARQLASSDVGSDVFNRGAPGTNAYFAQAASGNTGTATFGSVSVTNGGLNVGSNFTVNFQDDGAGNMTYTVDTVAPDGTTTTTPAQPYTDGATLDLGGVSVAISGAPQTNDSITVNAAGNPPASNDMDVFGTLNSLITALQQPSQGDPVSTAALRNMLATANKKISLNLDNVSTVQASVGARENELDALDSTGDQRSLTQTKTLSDITSVDYYSAWSALTLRNVSLQASMAAFTSIQGVSLFSQK
jgi:flagellar hook-associated protein 3 FlgL